MIHHTVTMVITTVTGPLLHNRLIYVHIPQQHACLNLCLKIIPLPIHTILSKFGFCTLTLAQRRTTVHPYRCRCPAQLTLVAWCWYENRWFFDICQEAWDHALSSCISSSARTRHSSDSYWMQDVCWRWWWYRCWSDHTCHMWRGHDHSCMAA
jgi:hypothetical protein